MIKAPFFSRIHTSLKIGSVSIGLLCTLVACGGSSGSSDDQMPSQNACSVIGRSGGRIIDGTECSEGWSPVVQLGGCTGTLLTSRHILTAAHCFVDATEDNLGELEIRLGEDEPGIAKISSLTVHPGAGLNEDETLILNDIAVVELDRDLPLPTFPIITSKVVESEEIVSIFGYGLNSPINSGEEISYGRLYSGQMKLSEVTTDFLFAEFSDEGSNTCVGDSGGPALLTFAKADGSVHTGLVGVTSSGSSGECTKGEVSAFANLQSESIISFIRSTVPGLREE